MVKTFTSTNSEKESLGRKKATIVEFAGPPGGGKTTSCRCFSELLQAKGYKVCLSQDLKDYVRKLGRLQKLALYANALFSGGFTLLRYTAVLARHKIYSANSIYRYLRLSIFDLALSQFVKTRQIDLVLLDQWVIQELWSATIFKTDSFHNMKPDLKKFYFKTDFVFYFDLDVETAAERIENRSSNLSRFDRMPPEKRLAELKKYNTYLHQLYENSDCQQKHTLSTKQSPYQNGELFLQLLEPALH